MKKLIFIVALFATYTAFAQNVGEYVRIVRAGAMKNINLDYQFSITPDEKTSLINQMGAKEYAAFEKYVTKADKPEGMRSAYKGNQGDVANNEVFNMNAILIAKWDTKFIVKIPKDENKSVTKYYNNGKDMYIIISEKDGLIINTAKAPTLTQPTNAEVEKVYKTTLKRVKLKNYSSLENKKLKQPIIDSLRNIYGDEVKGIGLYVDFFDYNNSFFKWNYALYDRSNFLNYVMKNCVAFKLASISQGDNENFYVLVKIPLACNQHFPYNIMPSASSSNTDFYVLLYGTEVEDYVE